MLILLPVTCRAVTVPGVVALPLVSIASFVTEPMLAAMAVRVPVRGTEVAVAVRVLAMLVVKALPACSFPSRVRRIESLMCVI